MVPPQRPTLCTYAHIQLFKAWEDGGLGGGLRKLAGSWRIWGGLGGGWDFLTRWGLEGTWRIYRPDFHTCEPLRHSIKSSYCILLLKPKGHAPA